MPARQANPLKNTFSSRPAFSTKTYAEHALQTLQQLCIPLLRDILNAQYLRISISFC
jgi:hypothetical protein